MKSSTAPNSLRGRPSRGVQAIDVERTADALLRAGERPTVEKIRAKLGTGSPNTINPLLDQWWQRLSGRLETGSKALDRLPEAVIHVAETLWHACLDEACVNAKAELRGMQSSLDTKQSNQALRNEMLNLREQELKARLADRDRTMAILESETKAFAALFRKEQAKSSAAALRVTALQMEIESLRKLLASLSISAALKRRTKETAAVPKSTGTAKRTNTKRSKQPSSATIRTKSLRRPAKPKRNARKGS
jgi:hypothetical protein